jgi:integrase
LTEADLLTEIEVEALLEAARYDVDQFRRWGIEKHIGKHGGAKLKPSKDTFPEMLRVYHATGARTSELAVARVRDFSARSRQIVLGKHKRTNTEKVASIRHINLSDETLDILQRLCERRGPDEALFKRRCGNPWTKDTLDDRFCSVWRIAVALGTGVREDATIYSFRDLWISDALMAGVDVMTVARMAGTSVRMIETVYGHFRTDHFAEAQRRVVEGRAARLAQAKAAANPASDARSSSAAPSADEAAPAASGAEEPPAGSPAA